MREALAKQPAHGTITWTSHATEQAFARIDWLLGETNTEGLCLAYWTAGDPNAQARMVVFERREVGFSERIYGRCPGGCGRTVRKLYLPMAS